MIIEEAMRRLGKREADLTLFQQPFRAIAENVAARAPLRVAHIAERDGVAVTVNFVWAEEYEFNAFAHSSGDFHLIGINCVVIDYLLKYFSFINDADFMRSYFNIEHTQRGSWRKIWYLDKYKEFRFDFFVQMVHICFDFIIDHELGHVWHGHTRLVTEERGVLCINDPMCDSDSKPLRIEDQALEMDADCFASGHVFNTLTGSEWIKNNAKLIKGAFNLNYDDKCSDKQEARYISIAMMTFALGGMFSLQYQGFDIETAKLKIHPPSQFRSGWVLGMFGDKAKEYGYDSEVAMAAVTSSLFLSTRMLSLAYDNYIVPKSLWLAEDKEQRNYRALIFMEWGKLRGRLDTKKIGGVLPPDNSADWDNDRNSTFESIPTGWEMRPVDQPKTENQS